MAQLSRAAPIRGAADAPGAATRRPAGTWCARPDATRPDRRPAPARPRPAVRASPARIGVGPARVRDRPARTGTGRTGPVPAVGRPGRRRGPGHGVVPSEVQCCADPEPPNRIRSSPEASRHLRVVPPRSATRARRRRRTRVLALGRPGWSWRWRSVWSTCTSCWPSGNSPWTA